MRINDREIKLPNVSRETFLPYYHFLSEWNESLSLISDLGDFGHFYKRHIIDSIQLTSFLGDRVFDWGSGNGIPGIPNGLLGKNIELIESNTKKATFLNQCVHHLKIEETTIVHNKRIQDVDHSGAKTITARALASVHDLLDLWSRINVPRETIGVFLKGENLPHEINEALEKFIFDGEIYRSISGRGYILIVKNVERKYGRSYRYC